jgi:hypothetical protein
MSSDIEKLAVFDDRIVQTRPRYAVEKGALSVTNSPFNAIAANTSQHTYNLLVPSENVFIDRSVDWTSTCYCQVNVTLSTGANTYAIPANGGLPLCNIGSDTALCPFPLQSLTTTMTATINDTTVTINSADVLPQVLRMTDYKKNRLIRTCPTMLDKTQTYPPWKGGVVSVLNDYGTAHNVDEVANGAFPGFFWTANTGQAALSFPPTAAFTQASVAGNATYTLSSEYPVPTLLASGYAGGVLPANSSWTFPLFFAFTSTEKLVLSPFVFSDIHEWDTGLFGCQNIQLVMNLGAPSRVLRTALNGVVSAAGVGLALAPVTYNTGATQATQAFQNSRVNLQFLTPSLDVPLPPKSVVPYMEFPRYISNGLNPIPAAGAAGSTNITLSSQTITLPQIPDLLIIYVKPVGGYLTAGGQPDLTQADWMMPIQNVSVNFDNFAGLLSAHTQQQLYKMSVHNGLEQDWPSWSGSAWYNGSVQSTVGGMLVLKPGRDIVLQAGQAPSLVGNFVLQFNLTVSNTYPGQVQPQIYVITANSGFFETIKGSSRVVKGVLTEQDIISAPVAPGGTTGSLRRAVGGNILGSLGNALSRVKGMFHQAPAVSKMAMVESASKKGPSSGMHRGNAQLMQRLM